VSITDALRQGTAPLTLTSGPTLASGDTNSDGEIDAGETWVYSATYAVTQANLDIGTSINNRATVDTAETAPIISNLVITPLTPARSLTVNKTQVSGPNPVTAAGQTIGYQIAVANTGNAALSGVAVSDTLVTGAGTSTPAVTFVSGDTDNDSRLDVGETWIYSASYTATQPDIDAGGTITNNASVVTSEVPGPATDPTPPVTPITYTPIDAVDDGATGVNGLTGAALPSVLLNDTLNSVAVVPADVTLTETIADPTGNLTLNPDGTLTVAPGTPAGTYQLTYRICEVLNPANCDSAIASAIVDAAPIDAIDDTATGVNGLTGATLPSVLVNDTLNGVVVVPADVTLTETVADPTGNLTLNPDGTLTVAPGTPAGTYQLTYRICEVLNPANCDTAVASATVDAAPIDAVDDSATGVNGLTGATLPSVLVNDTLNGVAVIPADVILTETVADPTGNLTLNPDGTLTVAPGTPGGNYQLTYRICEVLNPTNCDTAVASVMVDATPIDAVDDSATGVNGLTGATLPSVLVNDSLNGVAVVPADVTLTETIADPAGNLTLNPDGTLTVAPGTPAGIYQLTYRICEVVNPTNCDTAVASATVDAAPIDAVDDSATGVNGLVGATLPSVLVNDTLNGLAVALADVILTETIADPTGNLTLNPDGTLTVAPGTPAGTYQLTYRICEVLNPTNCDTAVASAVVDASPIDAVDNGATGVNGLTGATLPSVLLNDTLNGVTVVPAEVILTETVADPTGNLTLNPDGTLSVAPGTPVGTYQLTYRICEVLNPTNCDTAVASATVDAAPIDAVDDGATGVNGLTGATLPSVLINDTLNGVAVVPADVVLTETVADPTGNLTLNPDGTVTVAPGTPAGSYQLTYRICEVLNPTNCDTAVASATVDAAPIDAVDDAATSVNGLAGATLPSVLLNDTLNGVAVVPADVVLTETVADPTGNLTLNPDGTLTVAPGTPAGVYQLTYRICEVLNPTNCDTAVASATVDAAPIDAVDDGATGVNGLTGATLPSVLLNDTLNGVTVVPANITLTETVADPSGNLTLNPDGTLTVAPGTPAGTYQLTYRICEVLNPTNCDTAVASAIVDAAPIDAVDDGATGVNGLTGATLPSVLVNDTLNGVAVVPVDVVLTETVADPSGSLTLNPDGTLGVAPGTPAGTYQLTYRICEVLNPTNCDTAVASVTVNAAPIDAVDDSATGVNGFTGATLPSVLVNDTLNGVPVVPADVALTETIADPTGNLTLNPDGTLTVAPGTPAGTYQLTYRICEVLNPTNCDTAVASATVDAAPIDAVDNSATGVNGFAGATLPSVLANDTLNGVAVVPADVALTETVADPTGNLTLNPDGTLTVAPGTPAGTYQLTYRICEVLNPTNCDTAVASATVDVAPIDAVNDSTTGVNGLTGATLPSVLANDTLNGTAVVPADVTLAETVADPTGNLTLNPDGTLTVAPGTPAGTYQLTYRICEVLNPTNCDTAVASVTVDPAPINAVDDSATGVNGLTGATLPSVLVNDTLNGVAVVPTDVTLTETVADPSGNLTLNPDGTLTVAPGTPAGPYQLTYRICENLNPTNCDTAVARVEVIMPPAVVTGTVYRDVNGNGIFDGDPPAGSGYIVELRDATGVVVASDTTNASGVYSIEAPQGTGYVLVFKSPTGFVVGDISGITLNPGVTLIDQDQPVDPSGIVYDAVTRAPVAGAIVSITTSSGTPLPAACLIDPTQQPQTTAADGAYRFDLVPGAAPQCPLGNTTYGISVTPPPGYQPGVSTLLPPQAGSIDVGTCPGDAVPGGSCQPVASGNPPPLGSPATYFLSVDIAAGDPDLINNHIAIDPLPGPAGLSKTANVTSIRRGERVAYVIEANNVPFNPARIVDVAPPGFAFVSGSATVNGAAATPAVSGRNIIFDGIVLPPGATIRVELTLVATAAVATGPNVNIAQLINPTTGEVAAIAKATVTVEAEHVFDCGDVIGKVFDDKDRNGYQDDGEPGLPGVRLATVNGLLITTDKHGRFHVPCADIPDQDIGSNFVMKLDTRTLPTGYRLTTENPRDIRLTRGKATKLNFGAAITRVVRLDLKNAAFVGGSEKLKPEWRSGIDKLLKVLDAEPSTLRITYALSGEDKGVASKRVMALEKLIASEWKKRRGRYKLPVESRIVGAR
jgi:uncharacterized repeat protein (TIGR01451 family)